jgi:hypothetical protein
MTRLLLIATVAVSALGLTACDRDAYRAKRDAEWTARHTPKTIAKLDCPQTQGDLTLASAAPDGLSCNYTGKNAEVTLKLVALNGGDAKSVLDPLEAELRALIPPQPGAAAAAAAAKDAKADVDIDLPGVKIKAGDKGANISVDGGPTINAGDEGAEIRIRDDGDEEPQVGVKADDKDVSIKTAGRKWKHRQKAGVRSLFILATDNAASPYKSVGYDARGPKAGPLAIAVVKAKGDDGNDDVFDDAKALVKHNVGG